MIVAIIGLLGGSGAYLVIGGGLTTSQAPKLLSGTGTATTGATTSASTNVTTTGTEAAGFYLLGNSSSAHSLDGNEARKVFQAQGLTWVFYSNGTDLVYQTISNSSTSSLTVVGPETLGWYFSVWYDQPSDTVYYASTNASNFVATGTNQTSGNCQTVTGYGGSTVNTASTTDSAASTTYTSVTTVGCLVSGFSYGWGTPTASGTVDWNASGFVQTGSYAVSPYIYGNGSNVWVSLQTNGGASIEVWLFNGSSWNRVDEISTPFGSMNEILPLQSGVALIYATGGEFTYPRFSGMSITVTTNEGKTWSTPVTADDLTGWQNALSLGDTAYFVGVDNSSQVVFWSYTYGASAFSPVQVLASGYTWPFISTNGSSLVVSYADNSSAYIRSSVDLGASWGPQSLVATPSGGIVHPVVLPFYFTNSTVPACWLTGSGPYQVECAIADT